MLRTVFTRQTTGQTVAKFLRYHSSHTHAPSHNWPKAGELKSEHLPVLPPSPPLRKTKYIENAFPSVEQISADALTTHNKDLAQDKPGSWYFIHRSRSNQLPVYLDWKITGQVLTVIRKIEGNVSQLRHDLLKELGLKKKDITIKDASKNIVIRGNYSAEVKELLGKYF